MGVYKALHDIEPFQLHLIPLFLFLTSFAHTSHLFCSPNAKSFLLLDLCPLPRMPLSFFLWNGDLKYVYNF